MRVVMGTTITSRALRSCSCLTASLLATEALLLLLLHVLLLPHALLARNRLMEWG
jgi:hypothetical protein